MSSDTWNWKEIQIPVPFGSIRGKLWSNFLDSDDVVKKQAADLSDSRAAISAEQVNGTSASSRVTADEQGHVDRFIALHGWQDNCGTFDRLIPLLLLNPDQRQQEVILNSSTSIPYKMMIAAIDLPGHGLSSHYPTGAFYTDLAFMIDLKRVIRHLQWSSFSLLGHSMGGYVSIIYASLFPKEVERVITLDILKPLTYEADHLTNHFAKSIESFVQIESKVNQQATNIPEYTKSEAVDRLLKGHSKIGKLSRESAVILLQRGSQVVPPKETYIPKDKPNGSAGGKEQVDDVGEDAKVVFTRDPRLQAIFFTRMDVTTVKAYLNKLRCGMYVIKARNGIKLDADEVNQEFISLYQSVCPSFKVMDVDGEHHAHLCDPLPVARAIDSILLLSDEITAVCD